MCLLCAKDTEDWNRPASFLSWKWNDGVKIIMTVTNKSELLLREVNAFILTCQPYTPLQKHKECLSPYTCYGSCRVCSLKWVLQLSQQERGLSMWAKDNNVMAGITPARDTLHWEAANWTGQQWRWEWWAKRRPSSGPSFERPGTQRDSCLGFLYCCSFSDLPAVMPCHLAVFSLTSTL